VEWIAIFRALHPDDGPDSSIVRQMREQAWAEMDPSLRVYMEKLRWLSERFCDIKAADELVIAVETALERGELAEII
jgi:hypothetical protein